jgi:hypothetical protein
MKRLRRMGRVTRRQAAVAVGGGIWREVIISLSRSVLKLPMRRRSGNVTISDNVDEAIDLLMERRSEATPSPPAIREAVRLLYEALGVALSEGGPARGIA